MTINEIIAKKRDGLQLTKEELRFFIKNFSNGSIPDYQAAALLMAIYLNGMTPEETSLMTMEMADSGQHLDLSSIKNITVDKHSSGGVGDKTTLIIAPIIAACGLTIVKMSGRGLGHTGGTLDKLESIPGFNVNLTVSDALKQASEIGLVIAGQTSELAPADKGLYALRDVTETVSSIPLIASSIMSKKIASGADILVLDVKTGDGAFMKTTSDAEKLALLMQKSGNDAGIKTKAVISDMDRPLGYTVGNSLEVLEAVSVLKSGDGNSDLIKLCLTICGLMLEAANMAKDISDGITIAAKKLKDGSALEKLRQCILAQGGNDSFIDHPSMLPIGRHSIDIVSQNPGYVSRIHCEEIGKTACYLGAGRQKKEDDVDHGAGIVLKKKIGDPVNCGDILATAYFNAPPMSIDAEKRIKNAYEFSQKNINHTDIIRKII